MIEYSKVFDETLSNSLSSLPIFNFELSDFEGNVNGIVNILNQDWITYSTHRHKLQYNDQAPIEEIHFDMLYT